MPHNAFNKLFVDELSDLLSAEEQIVAAFPDLINAVSSEDLKEAFEKHFLETKNQVNRLNKIFNMMNVTAPTKYCKAMNGLIAEVKEINAESYPSVVKDAALIGAAQKIEHYEIAGYGTARTFAQLLELNDVADLLQETLDEEGEANKKLTKIAEGGFFVTGVNDIANQ